MKFQPGMPRPANSGRTKGVPNKMTIKLREALLGAFEEVGGQEYLVKVAQSDSKTFCQLLGRVLPMEIQAEVRSAVDHVISVKTYYENEPDVPLTSITINPAPALPLIDAEIVQDGREPILASLEPGSAREP